MRKVKMEKENTSIKALGLKQEIASDLVKLRMYTTTIEIEQWLKKVLETKTFKRK